MLDPKFQQLLKNLPGGFAGVACLLLWQIQTGINDQNAKLTSMISEIEKRVTVLEVREENYHVRQFADRLQRGGENARPDNRQN